jgi:hypothetical protein
MADILFSIKKTFAPLGEHGLCNMCSSPKEMNMHILVKYMDSGEMPFCPSDI